MDGPVLPTSSQDMRDFVGALGFLAWLRVDFLPSPIRPFRSTPWTTPVGEYPELQYMLLIDRWSTLSPLIGLTLFI